MVAARLLGFTPGVAGTETGLQTAQVYAIQPLPDPPPDFSSEKRLRLLNRNYAREFIASWRYLAGAVLMIAGAITEWAVGMEAP
jgi:hypothetical protein